MAANSRHNGCPTTLVGQLAQPTAGSPRLLRTARLPRLSAKTLYFAYESDMQIAYMAKTCPSSRYIGRATVTNYKWHSCDIGSESIVDSQTAHAYGLVFEVDANDRARLEKGRYPLSEIVLLEAKLFPAPYCLSRRQATWILNQGGPEAVLEREQINGYATESRAAYKEERILAFKSTEATHRSWPDPWYAEAISATTVGAMAFGTDAVLFQTRAEMPMQEGPLPISRAVRRPRIRMFRDTMGSGRRTVDMKVHIYEDTNADAGTCTSDDTAVSDANSNSASESDINLYGACRANGSTEATLSVQYADKGSRNKKVRDSTYKAASTSDVAITAPTAPTVSTAYEVSSSAAAHHRNERTPTFPKKRSASINGRRPMSRFDRFLTQAAAEPGFWGGPWPNIQPWPTVAALPAGGRSRRMSF